MDNYNPLKYTHCPVYKCSCGNSNFKSQTKSVCLYCNEFSKCDVCNSYHFTFQDCQEIVSVNSKNGKHNN